MFINYVIFWMMILEGVVCLIISLPFGQKFSQAIVQFLAAHLGGKDSKASLVATVILALVSILFLSDVTTVYKHSSSEEVLSDGMRLRLITAQRDMYITGFVLFLFLLLRLVYNAMATNIRFEKSLGAMKKQAEGAAAGFKQQLDENASIQKQLAKVQLLLGTNDDANADSDHGTKKTDVFAKLVEENARITTELDAARKALHVADHKVDAVKKQAESQSAAFMKLLDEKTEADKHAQIVLDQQQTIAKHVRELAAVTSERDALKSQIQDYDFMFAEAKKKAE